VLKTVSGPQGNPFGSGLLVRKSGRMGATSVLRAEPPLVVVCDKDTAMVVIAPNVAETSPILIECQLIDRAQREMLVVQMTKVWGVCSVYELKVIISRLHGL
jgi:hypothetical protein